MCACPLSHSLAVLGLALRGPAIALGVAQGLHFLHGRGIVHFDIKSPNILLSKDGSVAKIADVGLARLLNNRCALLAMICGWSNNKTVQLHCSNRFGP